MRRIRALFLVLSVLAALLGGSSSAVASPGAAVHAAGHGQLIVGPRGKRWIPT